MKLNIFNKSIFKQPQTQNNYKEVIQWWWQSFGYRERKDYKTAILYGVTKQIFNAVGTIEMWEGDNKEGRRIEKKSYADVKYIVTHQFKKIFFDLYRYGYFCITQSPTKIEYFPASKTILKSEYDVVLKNGVEINEDAELKWFFDDTFEIEGKTTREILHNHYDLIDDLLNSSSTGVKRLGNVNILTPPATQDGSEILDRDTREKTEKYFRENYGGLEHQSNIAILNRSFDLKNISFDFGKLQLDSQFTREAQITCSIFGVPYDLLPYSGQSTYANQREALKILYQTAHTWMMYLQRIFDVYYGVKFEYDFLGEPKEDANEYEETRRRAIENVEKLINMGIFTTEQAKEELSKYYEL